MKFLLIFVVDALQLNTEAVANERASFERLALGDMPSTAHLQKTVSDRESLVHGDSK